MVLLQKNYTIRLSFVRYCYSLYILNIYASGIVYTKNISMNLELTQADLICFILIALIIFLDMVKCCVFLAWDGICGKP